MPASPVPEVAAAGPVFAGAGNSGARPLRMRAAVRLSKHEVFEACQALADADRRLVRGGHHEESLALSRLFELLEARLCGEDEQPAGAGGPDGRGDGRSARSYSGCSGPLDSGADPSCRSYSSASEFTQ